MTSDKKKKSNKINWSKAQQTLSQRQIYKLEEYNRTPNKCSFCFASLSYNQRHNKFCSHSCSASANNKFRSMSDDTKAKISQKLKGRRLPKEYNLICARCSSTFVKYYPNHKTKYCGDVCRKLTLREKGRINGRKAVQQNGKRSKNEILFATLCQQHFSNVEFNTPLFNGWDADIIIHDYKLAIMWNGMWHYSKITSTHSVAQVQNRDRIKVREIKQAKYIPYIIKDMGSHNPKFVLNQFNKLLEYLSGSLIGKALPS